MASSFLLIFLSHFLLSSARTIPISRPHTSTLNISNILSNTANVLTKDKFSSLSDNNNNLFSRDILFSDSHSDYKSLTLSRLARDAARVSSLTARVSFAVNGVKNSDLSPEHQELAASAAIAAPVVSGSKVGSGEYFSRVGVGSPPKDMNLVIDTGSDVTWVQCQPCADCYQQSDPVFAPGSSATYAPVDCSSDTCKSLDVSTCRNNTCLYQVSYGDGSYTVGDFATETLTLGGSDPLRKVAFGCGHDNEGLFVGAAGLLGLGGGALSFPSQISAKSFSYCLVDRDSSSSSTLDFDSVSISDMAVSATMIRNRRVDTFYYVSLTGITVGGTLLSIPTNVFTMDAAGNGGVIIDSGTAITRLQTDAYNALRDAFVADTRELPRAAGVALFDTCYDLSSRTSVEVPTVGLRFGDGEGTELKLPAKNYLIPVDSVGTFCLAFAPTGSGLSIVGNVQQQGTRVVFDLVNSRVGFQDGKC